ncbi:MAG: hypothetical protein JXR84_13960 [Anaerolineae bacterium]|nr:hypothetical protein [Anaerolineae bacterium]
MLADETITRRLKEMAWQKNHSDSLWPENCAGSRKALVIFVGPSPGGDKEDKRRPIKLNHVKPLWNEPYVDPLNWSRGFQVSFRPIVEAIIGKPYEETAKLIARFNMDWLGNPESQDVSYRYMWEGCSHILPVLHECNPELIIPMDEKTFGVLQIALYNDGYDILPAQIGGINIKISDKNKKARYHSSIMAFSAKKEGSTFVVIKSLQHPARIYDVEYAKRIGQTIREAAEQIGKGNIVNLNITGE